MRLCRLYVLLLSVKEKEISYNKNKKINYNNKKLVINKHFFKSGIGNIYYLKKEII